MNLIFDRSLLTGQLTMVATEVLETLFFASVDFHSDCARRLVLSPDRVAAKAEEVTGEIVQNLQLKQGLLQLEFSIHRSNLDAGRDESKAEAQ